MQDPTRTFISMLSFPIFVAIATPTLGDPTTCASEQLDWYTTAVGETPCRTFERLGQLCNKNYRLPLFAQNSSSIPGGHCAGQHPKCCCNSIAWSLSILCLECQRYQKPNSYFKALDNYEGANETVCGNGTVFLDQKLAHEVQLDACKRNIRIPQILYDKDLNVTRWNYTQIENAFINNLNTKNESTTPYRCPNMLALATEPFEQPENAAKTVGLIAGSTVGGVVGLVVIFCVLALVIILIQKKQRQEDDRIRRQLLTTLPTPYPVPNPGMQAVTPPVGMPGPIYPMLPIHQTETASAIGNAAHRREGPTPQSGEESGRQISQNGQPSTDPNTRPSLSHELSEGLPPVYGTWGRE